MSPVFAPATDQVEYELPEPGRYIATCVDIEDAPDKGFGPGVKWSFKLVDAQTGQTVTRKDGSDYTLWQWTSVKMSPKAKARPIIEALLGRTLQNNEVPDSRLLIGKGMVSLLIHEAGENGDRARLTSCKPYVPQGAQPTSPTPAPARNGVSISADASGADIDRALLHSSVEKAIGRAVKLGTPKHLDWIALDLDAMSVDDLEAIKASVGAEVEAALAD